MKLYRLGVIPWNETQAIYHALAERGEEAVVLCRPNSRYVCLGFHDDLSQEVDRVFCRTYSIPLIRRETGGGTVLLDGNQLFFQVILQQGNPLLSGRRDQFFEKFLTPAVKTLHRLGLPAKIQKPADVVIAGRKISGNGAGDIGSSAVYIGNILFAFDHKLMSRILNVPNDHFRLAVEQALHDYLTTLADELNKIPAINDVENILAEEFRKLIPELEPACYNQELKQAVHDWSRQLRSTEALELPGRKMKFRQVKIKEETYLRLHYFPDRAYEICLVQQGIIVKSHYYQLNDNHPLDSCAD